MRKLLLTPKTQSFLDNLPAKPFRQVVRKIFSLMKNPQPPDSILLSGYPYFRTDIGEYRIVYRFDWETLYLLLVGKRNDDEAYKELKRIT